MTPCPFEERVLASSSGEKLADDFAEHVESCVSCQEGVRIRRLMRIEAAALAGRSSVPPAARILWRARLRRTNQNVDRACRPVYMAQGFSFLATVVYLVMTRERTRSLLGTGETIALGAVALVAIGILLWWWTARVNWRRIVLQSVVARVLRQH
jgi:hypothetical protein